MGNQESEWSGFGTMEAVIVLKHSIVDVEAAVSRF